MFRVHFLQVRRWLVDGCRVESPSLCRLIDHRPERERKKRIQGLPRFFFKLSPFEQSKWGGIKFNLKKKIHSHLYMVSENLSVCLSVKNYLFLHIPKNKKPFQERFPCLAARAIFISLFSPFLTK